MTTKSTPVETKGLDYVTLGGWQVAASLYQLVEQDILPGTGIDAPHFWREFEQLATDLAPINQELLTKRLFLQTQINLWHQDQTGQPHDQAAYEQMLKDIGYLTDDVADFEITPTNVDPEIAQLAGPQLVVPVMNARYALNAANARWGSLYDALYATDAIDHSGGAEQTAGYNPIRGARVINFAKDFLDQYFPLNTGQHTDVQSYQVESRQLRVNLANGDNSPLATPAQFVGYRGEPTAPTAVLLIHNGLHVEIQINRDHPIGRDDSAGVCDLLLEAALTTIQDCEDSVAAVDAEDKVLVYQNWLGLMKGDLSEEIVKGDKTQTRSLNPDRHYTQGDGRELILPGRSLMFVRNVGHLMTNNAILMADGSEIPEGILDSVMTSLIGLHDLKHTGPLRNSRTGSIYIVKPKMHGPEEVAFSVNLFDRIEQMLGLIANTLKMGLMDEERRTSANLKQCIYQARERVVFINTGFMDRTGDEIHTSMEAGPVVPKNAMKQQDWINAYEQRNVAIGLACGLQGKAQIGKGMWPVPDHMAQMLNDKIAHPKAGANCAWVPSPVAGTLHALHYHRIDVAEQQDKLSRKPLPLSKLLTVPLLADRNSLTAEMIDEELDNNIQGILGYVVRWVDQGVGCSKVPDINHVGLMEDRATLRISSQHVANWLHHGICTAEQIEQSLVQMAKVVESQNAGDHSYQPMLTDEGVVDPASIAFMAAHDLIFKGSIQPSGYTEPVLHSRRLEVKGSM